MTDEEFQKLPEDEKAIVRGLVAVVEEEARRILAERKEAEKATTRLT